MALLRYNDYEDKGNGKHKQKERGTKMKSYKVQYIQQTKSRSGAYNYKYTDTVQAENEQDAKIKIKELLKEKSLYKRYTVIFKSIMEVK